MATDTFPADSALPTKFDLWHTLTNSARVVLTLFASLQLTVVLFALSIWLIFVGTLAQVELNMWEVIDQYFRSAIAWVDFNVLFPVSWFPELHHKIPGKFPMPGGFSIGVLMALNLMAAHLIRFKIQSKGTRSLFGAIVFAVGAVITYFVIQSGHNADGLQGTPPFAWSTIWVGIRVALFACAIASGVALFLSGQSSFGKKSVLVLLTLTFAGLGIWASSVMLTEPSLRILWQLIQGGLSGLVLLVGCIMLFKRRAGVVLLHLGIGLMMFSEFFVGKYAVEGRITLNEGETVNYARDIRSVELAVVDASDPEKDNVIAVPGSRLLPPKGWFNSESGGKALIADAQLPFDIHVEEYMKNSDLVEIPEGEENYATDGIGKRFMAKEVAPSSGTDGGEVDFAAAYVEIRKKGTEDSLGRYLLSQLASSQGFAESITVGDKTYDVSLRFKRSYKPYSVALKDVRKDDYLGTNMPMNYSSDVVLTRTSSEAPTGDTIGEFHIWMNNPLRYAGETFYQSGYNFDPRTNTEATTLQVVRNTGWMMPYIGCMLVGVGMAAHFCISLWRFLVRKLDEEVAVSATTKTHWVEIAIPFVVVLICGSYVASKFRPPTDTKANMRIHEIGKLPVVFEGRVKPLDTLARNTLRIVSNREQFYAGRPDPEQGRAKKLPAIRWLMDVIAGAPEAKTHRVFRIDHLDVLGTLGLERRKGFRYAEEEFADKINVLEEQLEEARKLEPSQMSLYQKKLVELARRIRAVRLLEASFTPIPLPEMPTEAEFAANREEALSRLERIKMFVQQSEQIQKSLNDMEPPLAVPTDKENEWEAFANAAGTAYIARFTQAKIPEATRSWAKMLSAYRSVDVNAFNEAVFEYQQLLANNTPSIRNAKGESEKLDLDKVRFEHFFNSSQPFVYSIVLYIFAFILVACGWLAASFGKFSVFNRTSFWLIVLTFALHSFALWSRIYISGRPPITNLYSSAVFIGWGAVGLGILLEIFYRIGVGNALAAICGFSTLLIAYALAADGDTFTVLRAVLDTQFWLATHVVCITLGYATTFVAGVLGVLYVLSMAQKRPQIGKALTSMTYGTLCFAIFFSFIGTVLGGLWADDSWGRFWGWDPKENGALMIVLWNALVLHARWGGMVRQRGLALLAIFGNVVTAWSWFGVNELGVGLHSYGFTEGVLKYLGIFVASQLLIMGIGVVMMRDGGDRTLAA